MGVAAKKVNQNLPNSGIIEYVNKYHRGTDERFNREIENDVPGTEDFFRFEKIMSK